MSDPTAASLRKKCPINIALVATSDVGLAFLCPLGNRIRYRAKWKPVRAELFIPTHSLVQALSCGDRASCTHLYALSHSPFAFLGLGEQFYASMRVLSCPVPTLVSWGAPSTPIRCLVGLSHAFPMACMCPGVRKVRTIRVGWAEMAILAYTCSLDGQSSPTDLLA